MSEKISLAVEKREETGRKVRTVAGRRVPAVIYGHQVEAKNIWIDSAALMQAYKAAGENTVIELTGDTDKDVNVLIHDIQMEPISHEMIHVDLFQVRMDEAVDADIPLVFVGESPAVKALGGTLVHADSVSVRALPGNLPHEITIDIAILATFDDNVSVSSLDLGKDVEILTTDDVTIASVSAPRSQEEVDAADEEVNADVSQVEGASEDAPAAEGEDAPAEESKEEEKK